MVEIFNIDRDYKTIAHWHESRGMPVPPVDMIPTFGLIEPGVAAGFLMVTDCNLAIVDFYVTNPEATREARDAALDQVTIDLIKYGNSVGITNFKTDSQVSAIKDRAQRLGFSYLGETALLFFRTSGASI